LSGANEPGDGVGGFLDLDFRLVTTGPGGIDDAMLEMVVQQSEGDAARPENVVTSTRLDCDICRDNGCSTPRCKRCGGC